MDTLLKEVRTVLDRAIQCTYCQRFITQMTIWEQNIWVKTGLCIDCHDCSQ